MNKSETTKNIIIPKREIFEIIFCSLFYTIIPLIFISIANSSFSIFIDLCIFLFLPFIVILLVRLLSKLNFFQNNRNKIILQILIGTFYALYFMFSTFLTTLCILFDWQEEEKQSTIIHNYMIYIYLFSIFLIPIYTILKINNLEIVYKKEIKKHWFLMKNIFFLTILFPFFASLKTKMENSSSDFFFNLSFYIEWIYMALWGVLIIYLFKNFKKNKD